MDPAGLADGLHGAVRPLGILLGGEPLPRRRWLNDETLDKHTQTVDLGKNIAQADRLIGERDDVIGARLFHTSNITPSCGNWKISP